MFAGERSEERRSGRRSGTPKGWDVPLKPTRVILIAENRAIIDNAHPLRRLIP
jgi:hypothetical protein